MGPPPIGNIGGGVYWKPIFNVMEGLFEMVLVNAQHMKAVPGRKTDTKDAEWIADLLQHGLLKASFIPPQPQRDLRDLTRYRCRRLTRQEKPRTRTWERSIGASGKGVALNGQPWR